MSDHPPVVPPFDGPTPEEEQATIAQSVAGPLFARPWQFVKGVVALSGLPTDRRAEVAFVGRSNVGKSSLINALVGQKSLARTSNTPGRTQEINYFEPGADAKTLGLTSQPYLVDLPGYGYAAAPKSKVEAWTRLINSYLRGRAELRRVFLLIDARHGLKANDHETMDMLDKAAVSYQLILTKIDKLKRTEIDPTIKKAIADKARHVAAYPDVCVTSSQTGEGIETLRTAVAAALLDR
ncbi:MAG: ribosome biogenesis GTP-binding protein YihA/YsxC [Pseudomonadota bacterium]